MKQSLGLLIFVSALATACTNNYRLTSTGSMSNAAESTGGSGSASTSSTSPAAASLSAVANPSVVVQGKSSVVTVTANEVSNLKYNCTSVKTGQVLLSGNVDASFSVTVPIEEDTTCVFQGDDASGAVNAAALSASVNVGVNCGDRIYDGGSCVDFSCKSVVTLTDASQLLSIPARSADGICYAFKLMSAIANSSSSLTTTIDTQVISRNHDASASNPSVTHNPYMMGEFQGQYLLQGPRVVKLAGGANATDDILVDNFVLFGVYPAAGGAPADLTSAYQVLGTSDSSIANSAGVDTHAISFMNQLIPVTAFASGGTSSLSPVDITAQSPANVLEMLDIRALDCGGSRHLSDVYLLFQ